MPRSHEVQSGPEDSADAVCYSDGELVSRSAAEESDSDYEGDSEAATQQSKKSSSSSSLQVNQTKQSAANARAAAELAASSTAVPAASSPSSADKEISALKKQLKEQNKNQAKHKRELDDKLNMILQHLASNSSNKRAKPSNQKKDNISVSSNIVDDGDSNAESGSDNDNSNGNGGNSNSPSNGKQDTLRKQALLKFDNFSHVDIRVFFDKNITVRKEKELVSIEYVQGFIAAWSAFNAELQQFLLRNNRVADALMVTNYYNQLIGLLTEYNTQWKQIAELDDWIRGERFKLDDHVLWDFHHRHTTLNNHLHRIQLAHLSGARQFVHNALQERALRKSAAGGAHSTAPSSFRRRDNKSVGVCYAYNGEQSIGEWSSTNYCRGADQCKFAHKCAQCYGDHAMYENSVCAAKPKDGIRAASRK